MPVAAADGEIVLDEQVGLQPLDGLRRSHERDKDEGHHIDRKTPHHAIRQRIDLHIEQGLRGQRLKPNGPSVMMERGSQQPL